MRRDQLLARGVTVKAIRHRLSVKRLFRIYRGVYALQPKLFGRARYRAAVYACGEGAVLSHRAAAAHQGLRLRSSPPLEVTVPRTNGCRPKGVKVYQSRSLPPEEITEVDGIPCTTWARTIIDCAAVLPAREVDRMIERSMVLRVFDLSEMRRALERARGRRGTKTTRSLLARFSEEAPTRSEFERRFLDLIREHGLPEPIVNQKVEGHEVDFHWPDAKVIVETDGRETHDTPFGWEEDHERDLDLDLADWHVIRITWRQLKREPRRIAQLLLARLSLKPEDCRAA